MAHKGTVPWNKGLTKLDPRVAAGSAKIQKSMEANPSFKGKRHSDGTRGVMSLRRKALYDSGWEPTCGRCKKYDYVSPIAGKIKVDGTWELKVAQHLDTIAVRWRRNKERFPYIRPDGRAATYQPDFFVEEWNTYIEVKGYQTPLDEAKWSQFPHKLEVWKRAKIENLEGKV